MSPKVPTHNPLYVDDLPNLHADAIVFSEATTYGAYPGRGGRSKKHTTYSTNFPKFFLRARPHPNYIK